MVQASRPPRRHLALDEVTSTNLVAMDAARSGDPGGLWITAERQSLGRGRRERPWVSERGNLYASLLLIDAAPLPELLNLPLVVALGVRNGLAGLAARQAFDVRIKWPNDILVNGRKCVGILLESERLGTGRVATVVGCGVNVETIPEGTPYPVTGLRREGVPASLPEVFQALASGVEAAIALWQRGGNFDDIRRDWTTHAVGMGQPCAVHLADSTLNGIFSDLDELGRLVLIEPSGRRHAIAAGELFPLG